MRLPNPGVRVLALVAMLAAFMSATVAADAHASYTLHVKSSWYGGPCDREDNNQTATGIPNTVPGIALYERWSYGRFFLVTAANHRKIVVRHIEYGPRPSTGRGVDLDYTAAHGLGYKAPGGCVTGYPTDSLVRVTLLRHAAQVRKWSTKTRTHLDDRWRHVTHL